MERWAPVLGYEDRYLVSDSGKVLSQRTRRQMAFSIGSDGYPCVTLCVAGKVKRFRVHRLVLEAFVGPRPDGMEACHNNGIRTDARLENLRWGSRSDNQRDATRHGTHRNGAKTECPSGHPYDEENTLRYCGRRYCVECRRGR